MCCERARLDMKGDLVVGKTLLGARLTKFAESGCRNRLDHELVMRTDTTIAISSVLSGRRR